jgi:hypothetical protein
VTTEYQKLAAQLDRLERRVNASQRSRLGNASLENSSVPSYDGSGTLQSVWGVQYDGIHGFATVAGPVPPTPGGFEVTVGPGHLLVNWLGEWDPATIWDPAIGVETPVVAPSDFQRVELHVSEDAGMSGLLRDTLKTTISTPRGAEARIDLAYGAVVYFRAVTRSTSGRPSVASPLLGPFTIPALTEADLAIDLEAIGGNKISRSDAQPAGPNKIGDLWLQTPSNVAYRWEGSPGSWVASRDQGIVQALNDAFQAQQAATQAGVDALAAQGAAGTAQGTANTALSTANTKTTTFSQPGQPGTTGRVVGDEWIDTDDGNKRYYWNGSAWTAGTLGAAAIAATARQLGAITTFRQSAAPTTGMIVGDFWVDSDDNKLYRYEGATPSWVAVQDTAIQTALTNASNAAALADGKMRVFVQTAAPTGLVAGDAGDVWIDTDDGNKTYTWDGTTLAWVARTWGASAISATARQLGAITTFRQAAAPTTGMIDGDFWIDSDDGNKVWIRSGGVWLLSRDPDINAAITNAATAQATADGKMRIFPQATAPTGLVATDIGDMWIDTDDGNKTYTWTGSAWDPRLIGNSAIQPQSLIASNVVATGTVTAALLEAIFIIANVIIAGDANGDHTRLDSSGLAAYALDQGIPYETDRYGKGWSVRDAMGQVTASTTQAGFGSFTGITVDDPDIEVGGKTMAERDWERPWGVVGYAELPAVSNGYTTATDGELGFLEIAFTAVPGRAYKLLSEPVQWQTTTGTGVRVRVRRTTDGTTPSTSSNVLRQLAFNGGSGWVDRMPVIMYLGGTAGTDAEDWRLLVTYGAGNGATGVKVFRGEIIYFWVEDVGPVRENIGVLVGTTSGTTSGGSIGGGTTTAKTTKTIEFGAQWSRSWRQDNTSILDDVKMHQGYADSFNGSRRAAAGFGDLTGYLSGATINSAYVYLYAEYWWAMSGGVLRVGYHNAATEPAIYPGSNNLTSVSYTARGHGKWIRIDNLTGWKAALLDGSFKGISISAPDNSSTYYGRCRGAGEDYAPRVQVTYTK